jgi:hypothetical protein
MPEPPPVTIATFKEKLFIFVTFLQRVSLRESLAPDVSDITIWPQFPQRMEAV